MVDRGARVCRRFVTLVFVLAIAVAVLGAGLARAQAAGRRKPKPLPAGVQPVAGTSPVWLEVEKKIGEQKFQAALDQTLEILKSSRASGDERLTTEALIKASQLQLGLHGYETSVRFLKDEPWPKNGADRALLDLYYAHALMFYQQMYGWEIRTREKTSAATTAGMASGAGVATVDLKAWTTAQIGEEIARAFDKAMSEGPDLGAPVPAFFGPYLRHNSYPVGIRPTLRDAVVYLATQHLANTQFWQARESGETYKLDFAKLSSGKLTQRIAAADATAHPLLKAASWLGEHAAFHAQAGRTGAALEARYQIFRILHAATSEERDQKTLRDELEKLQSSGRARDPWWAMGQALLADFIRGETRPGRLIDARRVAQAGEKAFPGSEGARACSEIIHEIEAPDYSLASMRADGPGKRSLLVTHRNEEKLYLKFFPVDWRKKLGESRGNGFMSVDGVSIQQLVEKNQEPASELTVDLIATPDYSDHRALVKLPLLKPGAYVIVGSLNPNFRATPNLVHSVQIIVSNLVMSKQMLDGGESEIKIRSGKTGLPLSGVQVKLYQFDWNSPALVSTVASTSADGVVKFSKPTLFTKSYASYFVLAERGDELAVDQDNIYFGGRGTERNEKSSFVYTDRSIYRPQQSVFFKVVAYSGKSSEGRYETAKAGQRVNVQLMDPNNQIVAKKELVLGSFGSASGQFLIPSGRPLGGWRIYVSEYNGNASVRVEEYKRPTFEPSLKEAKQPLRLNQKAILTGEARYYFGLPVTTGNVTWRVTKQEVVPWWWERWGWFIPGPARGAQTAASGVSRLKPDGTFDIEFVPEADERKAADAKGVTYTFRVDADVTDEGGETRSASRSYRLGFVALDAKLDAGKGFFKIGEPEKIEVRLADLDGKPVAGHGEFKLSRLEAPRASPFPSDLASENPQATGAGESPGAQFAHPDDRARARWETAFHWESVTHGWRAIESVKQGAVEHDQTGMGTIALAPFKRSGIYRVEYKTKDAFGATLEVSRDFIVGGATSELALPLVFEAQAGSVDVGSKARFLLHSALPSQKLTIETYRAGKRLSSRVYTAGKDEDIFEVPVTNDDRGGFTVRVSGVRDHQALISEVDVAVPWKDRELNVEFATFRDRLRPGAHETFRISVKSDKGKALEKDTAEVLAYMYDRSLDLFAPHSYPSVSSLYPRRTGASGLGFNLGQNSGMAIMSTLAQGPGMPSFVPDTLVFEASYGIGGPGQRGGVVPRGRGMQMEGDYAMAPSASLAAPMAKKSRLAQDGVMEEGTQLSNAVEDKRSAGNAAIDPSAPVPALAEQVRTQFSEQAFFTPHLVIDKSGTASVEFTVPDSVTSWRVLAHALTRDLRGGSVSRETKSIKELMVRPYVPRFLREGDEAEIKVVVNNASEEALSGDVTFDIQDAESGKSVLADFGLTGTAKRAFKAAVSGSDSLTFKIKSPKRIGEYAFKVVASAKGFSDGERRPFPVLPSRVHLTQSRFVTLRNQDRKLLEFKDLAAGTDPTLLNEQLAVSVDAQLFYGVLQALPYLVEYPYECTEQTLNRFLSTGIVSSVFSKYPAVAKMAKEFSARKTERQKFDEPDANRKMSLEETPWLQEARGGRAGGDRDPLINVLNAEVASAQRDSALARLKKMQLANGAFPWFEGGPPDEHMTLYILLGMSRALEFKVDVPKATISKGWQYVRGWLDGHLEEMMRHDCCSETITLINFVLNSYPDDSWTGNAFDADYRKKLLEYSFAHWKLQSPLVKGYLALTLNRAARAADAKLVWDSVMDSAKNSDELGTYWAPEERSWLWYNDTIESHAFSLRVQMELNNKDKHNDGLVQWLFLNKKLNHWKSTRATAEVIYSLVGYLDRTSQLGTREVVSVDTGAQKTEFVFDPDKYTGKKNQIVIPGEKIDPKLNSKIEVKKSTPGFAFASATWQFSTDTVPASDQGDFFGISRRYFRRVHVGDSWTLEPLVDGAKLRVGDQLEVQLSLKTKHEAEYVHLRDPRAAGLEPETLNSGYKWDYGLSWYEETRDSGSNFFFSRLPVGEYTFKYRLRANMAGVFRVGPATVQSMYAPEFNAYSAGNVVSVAP